MGRLLAELRNCVEPERVRPIGRGRGMLLGTILSYCGGTSRGISGGVLIAAAVAAPDAESDATD